MQHKETNSQEVMQKSQAKQYQKKKKANSVAVLPHSCVQPWRTFECK